MDRSQKYPPGWYVMQRVGRTGRHTSEAHFCSERCLLADVERRRLWVLEAADPDQTG